QVADVTITGNEIKGHLSSREPFRTSSPPGHAKPVGALLPANAPGTTSRALAPPGDHKPGNTLLARKVTVNYQPDPTPTWANMLISWAPFLLLIGFWVFFMRQMQSGGNKAPSFCQCKATRLA